MDDQTKFKENVIPFPGLKERLVEQALELLQGQYHTEAIQLLEQAIEMDPNDQAVCTSLAVAYYEDRQWMDSKSVCERMLREGIGEYEEILELLVMNLIQLRKHDEIKSLIQPLIDEGTLAGERAERFTHLMNISEKKANDSEREEKSFESFHLEKGLEQQTIQLAALSRQNIHPIKQDLIDAAEHDDTHPFIKTMLLNIMREQSVNDEVVIRKWGIEISVCPSELVDPFDQEQIDRAIRLIEEEGQEPHLVNIAIDLLKKHIFLLYPLLWRETKPEAIAEGYVRLAKEYLGTEDAWDGYQFSGLKQEIQSVEKENDL
ncbi:tetratricopeptide repeat protein [Jeotgalibacillus sp. R-1-5s-1]|uniref:tetratricopeptide repeat protein n=1 Tax=Jeotgalibacillus sp. R-1-5s-1 TaxID=2555897 RepID=UPI00106918CE|nr:tetratricopeptide repeat protein [Jeotgalibacillus sp. R-1-5s-1]TFD92443.1 tetratricopeptide repeat protein [Jeotgalibacillus sp. R-1-5s-1]